MSRQASSVLVTSAESTRAGNLGSKGYGGERTGILIEYGFNRTTRLRVVAVREKRIASVEVRALSNCALVHVRATRKFAGLVGLALAKRFELQMLCFEFGSPASRGAK